MARNTPLSTLLTMLKAAIGDSLVVGTQNDARYKQLLSDKQQWLAGEWDFPFLKDRWDVALNPGDRYINFPTMTVDGTANINIDFERPCAVYVTWTNSWIPLEYGIDEVTEMNNLNPDTNVQGWAQQRNDPIQRWQFNGESQFEVWPIPSVAQTVRFVGQRVLNPLVQNNDTADLDDQFLVLSTAVDILMTRKDATAQMKMGLAQQRLSALRRSYPERTREIVLGRKNLSMSHSLRRRVPIITIAGDEQNTVIGIG